MTDIVALETIADNTDDLADAVGSLSVEMSGKSSGATEETRDATATGQDKNKVIGENSDDASDVTGVSDAAGEDSDGEPDYEQRKRTLEEQLQLLDGCDDVDDIADILEIIHDQLVAPEDDYDDDHPYVALVTFAGDAGLHVTLSKLVVKYQGTDEAQLSVFHDAVACVNNMVFVDRRYLVVIFNTGVVPAVVQRLEAAEDLCIFDVGLDLVQSLLKHLKPGMRLLPPVTRELLEKCLFMLKLASDDEDEEVVRNVMFFFERLVNG